MRFSRGALRAWLQKPTMIRIILLISIQAFLALLFDIVGLGAGSIGTFTFLRNANTFVLLLYPPILSSDGGIGVLSSRLGTALHLGSVKPQLFRNEDYFYTLISAVLTLGLFNGIWIGGLSYITNLIIAGKNRILNPLPFIITPILTLTLASLISSQLTSLLAFFVFQKGLNPDVWVYPTMSTINNVLSTLFYAGIIAVIKPVDWFNADLWSGAKITATTYFMLIPVVAYLGFMGVIVWKNHKKKNYWKVIREAVPIQTVTLTINSLTGGILSGAESSLKNLPQLFLIYPALIDTLADECTIVSNTMSTNLSLGSLEPQVKAIKDEDFWTNLLGVGMAGLALHFIYGIFGSLIVFNFRGFGITLAIALLINALGFIVVQGTIFVLIILSFRRGLDPDNFAVPIIAALANLVCSSLILFFTFAFQI
ncbi:MAG: hypothetical protein GF308_04305 [Candidatus Heimdallarchaeota archaeon]|nr:hypothetical protein [Candidatus Heimdallarchaeota archaeon]